MPVVNGVMVPYTKNINGLTTFGFISEEIENLLVNFTPKPGDVILSAYPKCGNTWIQQIIGLVLRKGVPVKNHEEYLRNCPWLEGIGLEILDDMPEPRRYSLHFDYNRVPKNSEAKYITVVRNPKDCLTSLYHFLGTEMFGFRGGEFKVLFQLFMKGEVPYNDFFDFILSWYEHRNDPNVLFLYYEKMKKDPAKLVVDIAKFIGPQYENMVLNNPHILEEILKYSSVDYMKEATNKLAKSTYSVDNLNNKEEDLPRGVLHWLKDSKIALQKDEESMKLVRKGVVGDWRSLFTEEQSEIMNDMIEKRLNGTEMYDYWKSNGCF